MELLAPPGMPMSLLMMILPPVAVWDRDSASESKPSISRTKLLTLCATSSDPEATCSFSAVSASAADRS